MRARISSTASPRASSSRIRSYRSAEGRSSRSSRSPDRSTSASSSRERIAFANACRNVRPIAITSPTDFMCVDRSESTPGNFSNANRGHFTTA